MRKILFFIFLIPIIFSSCERDFGTYYDRPLGQKMIYNQLAEDPGKFSTFIAAIDKVPGLKQELSSSGLYTVMAPDNAAFTDFFARHPRFKSIEAIPDDTLIMIVKYHILKFMFFQDNFLSPGIAKNEFDKFKYETRATLVYQDISPTGAARSLYYPSKLLNIYTPNFFRLYGVSAKDYTDVYGSGSAIETQSGLYINDATATQNDISSANGVVHVINKVLIPLPTIAQEIDTNPEYKRITTILKRQFVSYSYNNTATKLQGNNGDINNDGRTDSLWNRTYMFNAYIDNENPVVSGKSISLSAFLPSKAAFDSYLDTKLAPKFENNVDLIPIRTLKLLYQGFFSQSANWPSASLDAGTYINLLGDKVAIGRNDVKGIKMSSNGIVYQLNKVPEPNAFTGVTGPMFLDSKYWYFGEMLLQSGVLSGLTKEGTRFTIFCPTNEAFIKHGIFWDPSPSSGKPGFFRMATPTSTPAALNSSTLSLIVNNHIISGKELTRSDVVDGFYPTVSKNVIIVEGGKLHGFYTDTIASIIPENSNIKGFNGYFQGIDKAILYPQQSIYQIINSVSLYSATTKVRPEYTKFRELVLAAGLMYKDFVGTTSIDAGKIFTLFVPSNEAITTAQNAGLLPKTGAVKPVEPIDAVGRISNLDTRARLAEWLRLFFVQDKQVFTDGSVTGIMLTSQLDPRSTATDLNYVPVSVTYSGGVIKLASVGTPDVAGNVITTDKVNYPANVIAKDGLIHIIDNAFTSKY